MNRSMGVGDLNLANVAQELRPVAKVVPIDGTPPDRGRSPLGCHDSFRPKPLATVTLASAMRSAAKDVTIRVVA